MSQLSFGYGLTRVRDLVINTSKKRISKPSEQTQSTDNIAETDSTEITEPSVVSDVLKLPTASAVRSMVTSIEINGEKCKPTGRFWSSFFHRFGIADNVFRYFDHAEVFERVAARAPSDELRYCIERDDDGNASLLAVTNPQRPYIRHEQIVELLERFGGSEITYAQGVVSSTHTPRSGEHEIPIGADSFKNRFLLEIPVDGFSNPKIFLSLLRLVCMNGAVGYSQVFRSEINAGKDMAHTIGRALDAYDNNEGYQAIRQRFLAAQKSWASVHECVEVFRLLAKLRTGADSNMNDVMRRFHEITGDLVGLYGLANLDALSERRQRILPARCRVYDLINFLSEMATHKTETAVARAIQVHVGTLISDEFDLEGTAERQTEFNDFFLGTPAKVIALRQVSRVRGKQGVNTAFLLG